MPVLSRPHKKLTSAELLSLPDDGKRHELIDGVHFVTPSPRISHQVLVGRLFVAMANYLTPRRQLGRVFISPIDVVLSDYDLVIPDLVFVSAEESSKLTEANVQGAPALVVEVLSPSTRRRDEGIKRRLFDEKGVREYWLADPRQCVVSICRRCPDGAFPTVATLDARTDASLTTPLLPEFSLSVSELFAP